MLHSPDDHLTIREVVRRSGVPASALHFYERKGLVSSERGPGNQRVYSRHMLRRISLIIVAKRLGIPLADVAEVFAPLPADRAPTQDEWRTLSRDWKLRLEERRHAIERLERELTGCIGCGCLSMKACLLLNPDDALGDQGPGPVRLQESGPPNASARVDDPLAGEDPR
ncbi:redox-sensitive transcriptional activator SoxR [Phytomonospora endophytica]|uniref:MerR family redox-sensitive transcriptional activator SoxR n=1 Tax=Phytomonospora endophytica TaxID=714109 RepID=A0A841FZE2_9ACTN|nr:redox-sensitive transcriptional activator SoxR [Phytomonospora endophytica]MBB6038737.1 MerR family redox-sensitive transcriptional activator SoxR [Phytomonospora endophytica]GIG68467.1 redox-sensitive transcriptional activator SoxR [Phytomonospora endophytica]